MKTKDENYTYRGWLQDKLHTVWHVWRVLWRELSGRKYEPEVKFMDRFIPVDATVLQIGASDGRHALYMARKLKCRQIICFEPSPYTFHILNILKAILRLNQIHTLNIAAGARPSISYLVTPIKRSGHPGLAFAYVTENPPRPDSNDPARGFYGYIVKLVPVTSVDEYCGENGIKNVDFIRCDVEGSELAILRGATKTLMQFRPVLLLEVHPGILKTVFRSAADEVWRLLSDAGYKMYYLQNDQLVSAADFNHEPWRDYFCVPAERRDRYALS